MTAPSSRIRELYRLRDQVEAAIEREQAQMLRVAQIRDRAYDVLGSQTDTTTATLQVVAEVLEVSVGDLVGACRDVSIVRARHVAAAVLRSQDLSYPEIGRALGDRDHTTAMNSCRRVASDEHLRRLVALTRERLAKDFATAALPPAPALEVS